jgi:quercetin dioxygenase-like cupin family protein
MPEQIGDGVQQADRPLVRKAGTVKKLPVAAGSATQTQVLIGAEDGAPNFAMRRFIMGANGGMPRHINSVEHEQYVLRGRATVGLGKEVHQVSAGDVLLIPAGVPHYYQVVEAPFEFLCIVPNGPDQIKILDQDV